MSIKFIELAGGLNYSSLCCAGLFRATLQTFNNLVGGERRRTRLQLKSEGFFPQELSLKRKCSATGNMVNVREEGSVVTVTAGSASISFHEKSCQKRAGLTRFGVPRDL